jgi:hypothetical protein
VFNFTFEDLLKTRQYFFKNLLSCFGNKEKFEYNVADDLALYFNSTKDLFAQITYFFKNFGRPFFDSHDIHETYEFKGAKKSEFTELEEYAPIKSEKNNNTPVNFDLF